MSMDMKLIHYLVSNSILEPQHRAYTQHPLLRLRFKVIYAIYNKRECCKAISKHACTTKGYNKPYY